MPTVTEIRLGWGAAVVVTAFLSPLWQVVVAVGVLGMAGELAVLQDSEKDS